MIFFHILKKDLLQKKVITSALFVFVLLAALLMASSARMAVVLVRSVDQLFVASSVPDFVHTHAGEIDLDSIDEWAQDHPLVQRHQTVEMLNVSGDQLYFADSQKSEQESVMDYDFVRQNEDFDFLLDLDNQVVEVSSGYIAIPVFFKQEKQLVVGDSFKIVADGFEKEFIISDFVRDAQMNPAIISSKRLVVSDQDFSLLQSHLGQTLRGQREYLIEFQLHDRQQLKQFINDYQDSDLPKQGTPIDYGLLRVLNVLTDGLVVVVVVLISLLLILIALLCLRFTILTTLEEDAREIGVMKAVGIPLYQVRRLYLFKYLVLSMMACLLGFILAFVLTDQLLANVALYMAVVEKNWLEYLVIFSAAAVVFFLVWLFCWVVFRRLQHISAVEALRSGSISLSHSNHGSLSLRASRWLPMNFFLGGRDVWLRFRFFGLVIMVSAISVFLLIVPVHFLNTVQSPQFIQYMGVSRTDLRIDLQFDQDSQKTFEQILEAVEADQDVTQSVALTTYTGQVFNDDGSKDSINIEVGDFSVFPLSYIKGQAPQQENEIAISYLNASQLEKQVGEVLLVQLGDQKKELVISGIYQDVTNGGKTAKASWLPSKGGKPLRHVILFDLTPGSKVNDKVEEYSQRFAKAKVTDVPGYVQQTLGGVVQQLQLVVIMAVVLVLLIVALVKSLFWQMLIARDFSQIAIMHGLGISLRDIRLQYLVRSVVVILIATLLGLLAANTIGEKIVGVLLSLFGASSIEFVVYPLQTYVLMPALLVAVALGVTGVSLQRIRTFSISHMIKE